jgi:glycine/D-amino acid oxidase-like deaminating enzyme
MGWSDVVLLERDRLTSGTTWHAAGLMVTFGSTSETSTEMRKYTRDLYSRLEAETGQSTGFNAGRLHRVATDADRLEEYRRVSAFNRYCGVDVHEISPREVASCSRSRAPTTCSPASTSPRTAAPTRSTSRWRWPRARACRAPRSSRAWPVTGVLTAGAAARSPACRPPHGDIEAEYVVNCAGMWARAARARAGVNIPLQAAEHYYLITEQIEGHHRDLAGARGPAHRTATTARRSAASSSACSSRCARRGTSTAHPRRLLVRRDAARLGPHGALRREGDGRVPISSDVGIRSSSAARRASPPDLQPVVGEAPELKNYFVAAGLNSIGILTGGGMGRCWRTGS